MIDRNLFLSSLFGGGVAGVVVDVVLFPLDTLKTRLQAAEGFRKSGGFSRVYKGIGPQAIGGIPQAALFFCTYETFKEALIPVTPSYYHPFVYMTGASISEVVACFIRVPVEIVKQRRQTRNTKMSSWKILMQAYQTEGFRKGLYRGFGSMVIREIPFSFIQFPILEYLKQFYRIQFKNNIELESWEVANCGAIAGGTAAFFTTPMDVVKTRIMLADAHSSKSETLRFSTMMRTVYKENGIRGLFAGVVPRVLWITLGGYIFFGMYDFSKNSFNQYLIENT